LTSAAALVVWAAATPVLEDAGEVIVAVEEATPEAAAPLIVAVVPPVEAELRAEAQMALPAERTSVGKLAMAVRVG
jgi:hypothetical protein